jgi:predicted permease
MSILSDITERLRSLIFRRRDERELAEELQLHMEMEAEHQRRTGLDPAEARRRSRMALGGIEQVKEDVRDARGTRFLSDSGGDIRLAIRTLRKSPAFSITAILILAVGIGGATAVFSAVDAVLLQPLPYQQPGQLVRLYHTGVQNRADRGYVTPVHFLEYRKNLSSVSGMAAIQNYDETGADIGSGSDVRRIRTLAVTADYFEVLHTRPSLGRAFTAAEEFSGCSVNCPDIGEGAPVVILSHRLWQDRFQGDPAIVGKTLTMNGTPHTIIGVIPAGFSDPLSHGGVDAWEPFDMTPGRDATNADNHYLDVIARLAPGVSIVHAQAELEGLSLRLAEVYPRAKDIRARFDALKDDIVGSSSQPLELMLGAVALVLLLVCVNIANLMLVRGSDRTREFALRAALGAQRGRLVRQLLIESLVLAAAGAIAGLIVCQLAMSAIVTLGAGSVPRLAGLSLDARVLLFAVVAATLSAVAFGFVPAWRSARIAPADALRRQGRSSTGDRAQGRLRTALVVSQVAMAFVLLVSAGLLLASFRQLQEVPLGVNTTNVLTFQLSLPDARYDSVARGRFYEEVAAGIATLPGVRSAGGISRLPVTGDYNIWGVRALSGPLAGTPKAENGAENRVVSGEYFRTVGIPLLMGRLFGPQDNAQAPRHFIISKTMADALFPGVDAVGQRLSAGDHDGEIIGVVGDVAINVSGKRVPYVYHAHAQFAGDRNWSLTQVVATVGPPSAIVASVRRSVAQRDPQLVVDRPEALNDVIGRGTAQFAFTLRILLAFAGVALLLAALGLFGVLSYVVRLRSQEFGIRMALGAERGTIRRSVLQRGMLVAVVGVAIGLIGAVALSRVMAAMVFQISPLDPRVLIGSAAFMMIVAGAAAYLPARRATAVDPRTVLQ